MSQQCTQRARLVDWSLEGARAPLDQKLERHAAKCEPCGAFLQDVVLVREALADLPVRDVASERLDAIRFELAAAARQRTSQTPSVRPPPASKESTRTALDVPRGALLAAGAAITLLILAIWQLAPGSHESVDAGQGESAMSRSAATTHLAEGAVGGVTSAGPDEIFGLLRGRATFEVRPLGFGERFRVVVGDDTVEVRGTRFEVTAAGGRLMEVSVAEGHVMVTLADRSAVELRGGQAWKRSLPEVETRTEPTPVAGEPQSPPARQLATGQTFSAPARPVGPRAPEPRVAAAASGSSERTAAKDARVSGKNGDTRFTAAWSMLRAGRAAEAAALLDELSEDPRLDPARKADVLFWAAKAHARAGNAAAAASRARQVVTESPDSWHARDARSLLESKEAQSGQTP